MLPIAFVHVGHAKSELIKRGWCSSTPPIIYFSAQSAGPNDVCCTRWAEQVSVEEGQEASTAETVTAQ